MGTGETRISGSCDRSAQRPDSATSLINTCSDSKPVACGATIFDAPSKHETKSAAFTIPISGCSVLQAHGGQSRHLVCDPTVAASLRGLSRFFRGAYRFAPDLSKVYRHRAPRAFRTQTQQSHRLPCLPASTEPPGC